MKKQFVTHDIAILLEEIGCNERFGDVSVAYYYKDELLCFCNNEYIDVWDGCRFVKAPLWQQVIDWFREKHGILISVDAVRYRGGNLEWGYFISIRNNGGYIITGFEHKGIENPEKIPYYHSYEEAREAAILEAIKLLKEENK